MRRPVMKAQDAFSVSPPPTTPRTSRQAPAHAGRLDRLPHDADVARRLERVVGAEAAGQLHDLLDDAVAARERLRRAVVRRGASRPSATSTATIRSAPASRQPTTAPSPTMPIPKTTQVEPACTFAVLSAAPIPVERPQAKSAARSSRASRSTWRARSRASRVLGERGRAHEVPDRLAVAREAGSAVGQVALVLHVPDGEAEADAGLP